MEEVPSSQKKRKRNGGRKNRRNSHSEAVSSSPSMAKNSQTSKVVVSTEDGDGIGKRKRRAAKACKSKQVARSSAQESNHISSIISGGQDTVDICAINEKHEGRLQLDEVKASCRSKPSSTFLEKMKARLAGSHFRMINEKLYTCSGKDAFKYFNDEPVLFDAYHTGYQEQMSHWPEQPVNIIIKWLKDQKPSLVVADFGCGNAHLAKSVENKVFSIDLVSSDPSVIACDMANTPLSSSSVDVAVFCLSLMGTNYHGYLREACRVLKPRGWLLIAEVKSRFDPNTGGADPQRFLRAICELGFTSISKDFSNKMFILWHFRKKEKQDSGRKEIEWPQLKPCIYKRR